MRIKDLPVELIDENKIYGRVTLFMGADMGISLFNPYKKPGGSPISKTFPLHDQILFTDFSSLSDLPYFFKTITQPALSDFLNSKTS